MSANLVSSGRFERVLVTGPQRSGTRIAAKMIAQDIGYKYVDELDFGVHDREAFERILEDTRIVVQCPTMCHAIHKYADDETLVVLMVRDLDDIAASEERIGWEAGPYAEYHNYGMSDKQAIRHRRHGGRIAAIKYGHWRARQRDLIEHYVELEYESLAGHPLWIPKEQRIDFRHNQTA